MNFRLFLMLGGALGLGACGLTHEINPAAGPVRAAAATYGALPVSAPAGARTEMPAVWYESFEDPKLSALMTQALAQNLDIAQALARLRQADAVARQAGAARLPEIGLQGDSGKSWHDGHAREGYSAGGAALSWEIDLFNRLGAQHTGAQLRRAAAAADVDAVRLMLTAQLASAYYNAIAQHMQIALLRAQLEADSKFLDLVRQRHREGIGSRLDALRQESQVADTASLIPPAEAALRAYENRLDVLLGMAPDPFNRTAATDAFPHMDHGPSLAATVGVPADLLLNRPDLRALQNDLVAADAAIGAAIADLLPRVTLTGALLAADGPGAAGVTTSLLGGLVQPLLDWGRRQAEVERNRAVYEEKLAAFTQAYLTAVEEVENALYYEERQRDYIARLDERRRILEDTVGSAEQIFREGLSDYLAVLDATGDLRDVERAVLQERRNLVLNRIALLRAIGAPLLPADMTGDVGADVQGAPANTIKMKNASAVKNTRAVKNKTTGKNDDQE